MHKTDSIKQFTIRKLLEQDGGDYVIPMYQRNYAWGEPEITQLIQDIIDYLPNSSAPRSYYIGTLVVAERLREGKTVHETIDGQQRLTTLALLVAWLTQEIQAEGLNAPRLRLDFESRPNSSHTLRAIQAKPEQARSARTPDGIDDGTINEEILHGYQLIDRLLPRCLNERHQTKRDFTRYLLDNVIIMRVSVPAEDLNHYFEIMNSRGEQLEKHEILKSRLLEALKGDPAARKALGTVWEACSDMTKYVQTGFNPDQRQALFQMEDEPGLLVTDFNGLCKRLATHPDSETACPSGAGPQSKTLSELLENSADGQKAKTKTLPPDTQEERFTPVINFQNFLLQVLRIHWKEGNVRLDDKFLLEDFKGYLQHSGDEAGLAREFAFALLKARFVLDQYVIKHESTSERKGWSLKRYKYSSAGNASYVNTFSKDAEKAEDEDEVGQKILMLQSAFHVSAPTMTYKYWLLGTLNYLDGCSQPVRPGAYLEHLESLARAFMLDRYLADTPADYDEIIFRDSVGCVANRLPEEEKLDTLLSYTGIRNNFVFNYLDYRLYWDADNRRQAKIRGFRFTARSSVEHFYPQHPRFIAPLTDERTLHCFGNLCLIDASTNSSLSDRIPREKADHYNKHALDSIKQHFMVEAARNNWDEAAIKEHDAKMKRKLQEYLADHDQNRASNP